MLKYEVIMNRLKLTKKEIQQSIEFSYEEDDCTQCYRQGLIDSLAMLEWLFETIEQFHDEQLLEDKLTSDATVSPNQIPLPLDH
ncbi:MAG: hypothetical protein WBC91_26490 [Phototrophicaceae bacterium]